MFLNFSFSILYPLLQILELVKGMHYQLACQKYFELTHNVSADFNLEWGVRVPASDSGVSLPHV